MKKVLYETLNPSLFMIKRFVYGMLKNGQFLVMLRICQAGKKIFHIYSIRWSDQFLCLENVHVASDKRSVWKWYLGRWIHRKKKQIFRFPVNHLADQALRGIQNSKYLQIQILWNISQLLSEVVSIEQAAASAPSLLPPCSFGRFPPFAVGVGMKLDCLSVLEL